MSFGSLIKNTRCFQLAVNTPLISRCYSRGQNNPRFHAPTIRRVFKTPESQKESLRRPPEKIANSRVLQVAILGVPNAGKSTLVNQLSGWKTCSVSKKVHTTRKTARAVVIHNETQIVFLDTPGLVVPAEAKKYNLETSFVVDPETALMEADLLLVLHDVSEKKTRDKLSQKILRLLYLYPDKESILVLNKADLIKEKRLLLTLTHKLTEGIIGGQYVNLLPQKSKVLLNEDSETPVKEAEMPNPEQLVIPIGLTEKQVMKAIEGKTSWPKFSQVFMISALEGDGVDDIMKHLIVSAKPKKWIYNSSVVTDQHPHEIAISLVREKLLDLLDRELPYTLKFSIRYWHVDLSGSLDAVIAIDCRKAFTARIVVGTGGRTVTQIARDTEQELRNIFRSEVRLRLIIEPDTDKP